jgi:hypothetical protein
MRTEDAAMKSSDRHNVSSARGRPVLFHRRDERDSEAARELIIQLDGQEHIDFEDVARGSPFFEELGGGATPALWDGEQLHRGLAAIVLALIPQRPTARREMEELLKAGRVPDSYSFGEDLNWSAPWTEMTYTTELPFWLMVADCNLRIRVAEHDYPVEVRSDYWELYAGELTPSSRNAIYFGPKRWEGIRPDLMAGILENRLPYIWRRCRTVVRVTSRCLTSVADAADTDEEDNRRLERVRTEYLRSMCELHLAVVNQLIQSYRLSTYDYFPYEVSPWDVPIWYCSVGKVFRRVAILPYSEWDQKLRDDDTQDEYSLSTPEKLGAALQGTFDPAEFELIDALNRMERGDYTGAVRRVTTAAEAELERVLRIGLSTTRSAAEVEEVLRATRNSFPRRLRQYERLRGESVPDVHRVELAQTRNTRHDIVHRGMRIEFGDRGRAQRAVDTGRWFFNWLQNDPVRTSVRERRLAFRSLGRRLGGFPGSLTKGGPVIQVPSAIDEAGEPANAASESDG